GRVHDDAHGAPGRRADGAGRARGSRAPGGCGDRFCARVAGGRGGARARPAAARARGARSPGGGVSRGGGAHRGVRQQPLVKGSTHVKRLMRAVIATAIVATWGCGYNTIQTLDEQVNAAASQIKVQLQRRADLVPNLVETVKGYAKQEQTVFIAVADARAKLAGAVQSGDLQQMAQANAALTAPL